MLCLLRSILIIRKWRLLLIFIYTGYQLGFAKVIIQSSVCTEEELEKKIQCFKVVPNIKYEALVNDSITMRCQVQNQHGRVQWREKKIMLGYDRAIPARPRFSITGDAGRSEYFLTIRRLTLADSGEYECQAEPVGALHPPLRRYTYLNVYEFPTYPKIIFNGSEITNGHVVLSKEIVNNVYTDVIQIMCTSTRGVPLPKFKWLINNVPLKSKSNFTGAIGTVHVSTLTISGSYVTDGALLECRISNRPLQIYTNAAHPDYLASSTTIVFEKKPGKPSLKLMYPYSLLILKDKAQLKCTCNPPGLPVAIIKWSWSTHSIWKVPPRMRNIQAYSTYSNFENYVSSVLSIPIVTLTLHGTTILCSVLQNNHTLYTKSMTLLITYPPESVQITLPNQTIISTSHNTRLPIFSMLENHSYKLICKTSRFYGNMSTAWSLNVRPTFDDQYKMYNSQRFYNRTQEINVINKFYKTEISTILFTPNRHDHSSVIGCYIGNKNPVSVKIQLEVYYLPNIVVLETNCCQKGTYMNINDIIRIRCYIADANPLPELKILLDNRVVQKLEFPKKEISTELNLERSFNFQNLYCAAFSHKFPYHKVVSRKVQIQLALLPDQVILFVKFPTANNNPNLTIPYFPLITTVNSSGSNIIGYRNNSKKQQQHQQFEFKSHAPPVEDGQRQILECYARDSFPEPIIKWRLELCQAMSLKVPSYHACQMQELKASKTETRPVTIQGKSHSISVSQLIWQPTWRHHLAIVICTVENPFFPNFIFKKHQIINVSFIPRMFIHPATKVITIRKGDSKCINATVISNPKLLNFSCLNCSFSLTKLGSTRQCFSFSKLVINNASEEHEGESVLFAQNKIGAVKISIQIRIIDTYYRPLNITKNITLSKSDNILQCSYRELLSSEFSKLPSNWSFLWHLDDERKTNVSCNQILRSSTSPESLVNIFVKCTAKSSVLIFYYLDLSDEGFYTCGISLYGNVVYQIMYNVRVLVKPQIQNNVTPLKFACSSRVNCSIFCLYKSVGNVSLFWLSAQTSAKIIIYSEYFISNSSSIKNSTIQISNYTDLVFGDYEFKIVNSEGQDSLIIEVVLPQIPEPPKNLTITSVGYSTAQISWRPGFSGGFQQVFQIIWVANSSTNDSHSYAKQPLQKQEVQIDKNYYSQLSLDINDLSDGSSYYVKIAARNQLGVCELEAVGHFTTKVKTTKTTLELPNTTSSLVSLKAIIYSLSFLCFAITVAIAALFCGRLHFHRFVIANSHNNPERLVTKNKFISFNKRLYSAQCDTDKDLSMIFANRKTSFMNFTMEEENNSTTDEIGNTGKTDRILQRHSFQNSNNNDINNNSNNNNLYNLSKYGSLQSECNQSADDAEKKMMHPCETSVSNISEYH